MTDENVNTPPQNENGPAKFEDLPLLPETQRAVADMGFEEATPIQSQCITLIKEGRDVIGQSQTGTGKTAAFGIPLLEKIDPENRDVQALVLCPTRELAIQISQEFGKLLRYRQGIRVLPVYGGQPIDRQIMALKKGAQVVVGTPGRVMDHINRRTLRLAFTHTIVLDEADEMLDMGFREDIEFVLDKMEHEPRQTLLFSATMASPILQLTRKYQNNPAHIKVTRKALTVPSITQRYYEVRPNLKLEALCRLIDAESPQLSIVFCNTKRRVDEVVEQLQGRGYFAEGLHGDMKQTQRDVVMRKFRNHTLEILVATDVAARGIDVENIDIVFNYDLPQDAEYYVHRIGRTGRAGKEGCAFTFVAGREIFKLREIMHYTQAKIQRGKMPTLSDIEENKTRQFVEKIKGIIEEGGLGKYHHAVEALLEEDYSPADIAAALFKHNLHETDVEEINFDPPRSHGNERGREKYDKPEKHGGRFGHEKNSRRPHQSDENMARLFVTIGKKDGVRPSDIVGAIANEAGIPGRAIGHIDIYEEFTFVDVPQDTVRKVLSHMKDVKLRGKKISIEWARPK